MYGDEAVDRSTVSGQADYLVKVGTPIRDLPRSIGGSPGDVSTRACDVEAKEGLENEQ